MLRTRTSGTLSFCLRSQLLILLSTVSFETFALKTAGFKFNILTAQKPPSFAMIQAFSLSVKSSKKQILFSAHPFLFEKVFSSHFQTTHTTLDSGEFPCLLRHSPLSLPFCSHRNGKNQTGFSGDLQPVLQVHQR
jgi:hypothetical protein